jgi:glycosyltransferase involved in cell wall biosynthesis
MYDGPLVSAIVPAHNAGDTLAEAIESVLGQTYLSMECVVIDDGSTDDTAEVARSFSGSIVFERRANAGVAATRNYAASIATGIFYAFLDSDDIWMPKKIEEQVAAITHEPSLSYVYSAYWFLQPDGAVAFRMPIPAPNVALRNTATMTRPNINLAQTGFIRADTFDSLGGFDEALSTSADLDLVLRVALGHRTLGLEAPLAGYRLRPGQMSTDPQLMERDMERVLSKFFGNVDLPADLKSLQPVAYSNLHLTLAGMHGKRGERSEAMAHLSRAAAASWTNVMLRPFRRRGGL